MNDYNFGNFLCSLRAEKGLSQSQLGEMLGVTNKAVSKWENGVAKPNTNLLPKIAEIFDITVEELFAAKRIQKSDELEKIKLLLSKQKKKYANLVSIFLSALVVIPLLLIEFIFVVNGFNLPDEILGPIGAMSFIFGFIVCLVAFVIYKKDLRNSTIGDTIDEFSKKALLEKLLFYCIIALMMFILFISIHPVILSVNNSNGMYISLSICSFISILLLGVIIYSLSIKCIFKIKFFSNSKGKQTNQNKVKFSDLSLKSKILTIFGLSVASVVIILFSLSMFFEFYGMQFIFSVISSIICFICCWLVRKNR
ncbi:MAG: helix-turn-helix transcriptional regulator [Clostridia bacterium]|nr:helix-turn-helix transcriptional regulator [Clostridia bacterium]